MIRDTVNHPRKCLACLVVFSQPLLNNSCRGFLTIAMIEVNIDTSKEQRGLLTLLKQVTIKYRFK